MPAGSEAAWSVPFAAPGGVSRSVTANTYRAGAGPGLSLVLAHGAGAGQSHPFMVAFARGLAARGIETTTFNFPYTEQRRRLPDPGPVLEACFRAVVAAARDRASTAALFIGGKSMGGRIASQIAAGDAGLSRVAGLVFLGYPLHPPGKPEQLRTRHWPAVHVPALFVQGTRDPFGTAAEIAAHAGELAAPSDLYPVEGGDHSFRIARRPAEAVYDSIMDFVSAWMNRTR